MRLSPVCISSIALRNTMDQSGSQRTSFQFSIDAWKGLAFPEPVTLETRDSNCVSVELFRDRLPSWQVPFFALTQSRSSGC